MKSPMITEHDGLWSFTMLKSTLKSLQESLNQLKFWLHYQSTLISVT